MRSSVGGLETPLGTDSQTSLLNLSFQVRLLRGALLLSDVSVFIKVYIVCDSCSLTHEALAKISPDQKIVFVTSPPNNWAKEPANHHHCPKCSEFQERIDTMVSDQDDEKGEIVEIEASYIEEVLELSEG